MIPSTPGGYSLPDVTGQTPRGGWPGVSPDSGQAQTGRAALGTVGREWTRIGLTGFGGPPAHIALLRQLVVNRKGWMDARAFEDANAACGLLPGPASTQLAIFCAYRAAGLPGAIVGGLGFIAPAVALIIPLSALFLAHAPPLWVRGAGAGAGAAVAAVAVYAARALLGPSLDRVRDDHGRGGGRLPRGRVARWTAYLGASAAAAALLGPYLVVVLLACGLTESTLRRPRPSTGGGDRGGGLASILPVTVSTGGIGALAWTAFKVGALSFGGGFVIIPLMQSDAVHTYHWMTGTQFLNAVALGQITPGPVVATVAAVGYAAHGVGGGILAALVAFTPSFAFILIGGRRFERLRQGDWLRAFLDGAGPAAIGAILGAAVTLATALHNGWQFAILGLAAIALLVLRRGVVQTLLGAALLGVIAALAGASVP
jgi:chromate transporter